MLDVSLRDGVVVVALACEPWFLEPALRACEGVQVPKRVPGLAHGSWDECREMAQARARERGVFLAESLLACSRSGLFLLRDEVEVLDLAGGANLARCAHLAVAGHLGEDTVGANAGLLGELESLVGEREVVDDRVSVLLSELSCAVVRAWTFKR